MYQFANILRHELHEQSLKILHRKKIVEKNNELQLQQAQKECSQAEKLLEDQVEVSPTIYRNGCFQTDGLKYAVYWCS